MYFVTASVFYEKYHAVPSSSQVLKCHTKLLQGVFLEGSQYFVFALKLETCLRFNGEADTLCPLSSLAAIFFNLQESFKGHEFCKPKGKTRFVRIRNCFVHATHYVIIKLRDL